LRIDTSAVESSYPPPLFCISSANIWNAP